MNIALPVHVGPMDPPIPMSDLPKWRDAIVQMTLGFLKEDGRFDAVLLGVGNPVHPDGTSKQSMVSIPLNAMCETSEMKDALASVLPDVLAKMRCDIYVIVMDTYLSMFTEAQAKQYMETGEKPEGAHRYEALTFMSEDISGSPWSACYRYDRDENGKVINLQPFEEMSHQGAHVTGRFTNLLRPRHQAPLAEA